MASILPTRPTGPGHALSFAVVASHYNAVYVEGLVRHFRQEMELIAPGSDILRHEVPGAFEIPLLVQMIAERGGVDAIVAFGVIIEGATAHAALIGAAVTNGLQQAALSHRVPVLHEVLLVKNEEQARVRCLEPELNRGTEAARAAVRMAEAMSEFRH